MILGAGANGANGGGCFCVSHSPHANRLPLIQPIKELPPPKAPSALLLRSYGGQVGALTSPRWGTWFEVYGAATESDPSREPCLQSLSTLGDVYTLFIHPAYEMREEEGHDHRHCKVGQQLGAQVAK